MYAARYLLVGCCSWWSNFELCFFAFYEYKNTILTSLCVFVCIPFIYYSFFILCVANKLNVMAVCVLCVITTFSVGMQNSEQCKKLDDTPLFDSSHHATKSVESSQFMDNTRASQSPRAKCLHRIPHRM